MKKESKEPNKKRSHKKILAVLIGPPGSGKSYYCQHTLYCYFRISQDDFGKGHYKKFLETLLSGQDLIVVDRMNFNIVQRLQYVLPAQRLKYKIMYYFFLAPDNILLQRMRNRKDHPTVNNKDFKKHKELIEFFKNNYEEPGSLEDFEMTEIKTGEEPLNDKRNQET